MLVVGSGPVGIGCANATRCRLLEGSNRSGGLSATFLDSEEFRWDCGSHFQFSHYDHFDSVLDEATNVVDWIWHERSTFVWVDGVFVPYPFQLNLHRLPHESQLRCVMGLIERDQSAPTTSFDQWILATFGERIADTFMRPYNQKIWATLEIGV